MIYLKKRYGFILYAVLLILLLNSCQTTDSTMLSSSKNVLKESTNSILERNSEIENKDKIIVKYNDNTSYLFNTILNEKDKPNFILVDKVFKAGDTSISYPQLSAMDNTAMQNNINSMIFESAQRYYNEEYKNTLEITYIINLFNASFVSISFLGYQYYQNAAHPLNLYYCINLDLEKGENISLDKLFNIDKNFFKAILSSNYVTPFDLDDIKIIQEHLLEELEDDSCGNYDFAATYSNRCYFTKENLGVSFSVPHAFGSNIQFEIPYDELAEWEK